MKFQPPVPPPAYTALQQATIDSGFTMASETNTCSLLRTLAAVHSSARCLELGTGTGLSTSWILDGLDADSTLISVDNDAAFLAIARQYLVDERLTLVQADAGEWLKAKTQQFDFIFADTWHGKYLQLDDALSILKKGGFYVIDDMRQQPNWPEGHDQKADALLSQLQQRTDLYVTPINWASGQVICVKK